jgi:hypothetical protein
MFHRKEATFCTGHAEIDMLVSIYGEKLAITGYVKENSECRPRYESQLKWNGSV